LFDAFKVFDHFDGDGAHKRELARVGICPCRERPDRTQDVFGIAGLEEIDRPERRLRVGVKSLQFGDHRRRGVLPGRLASARGVPGGEMQFVEGHHDRLPQVQRRIARRRDRHVHLRPIERFVRQAAVLPAEQQGDRAVVRGVEEAAGHFPWRGNGPAGGAMARGECGDQDAVSNGLIECGVFTRAFDPPARLRFDGVREYAPYLTTIARNVVVDYLRRRQRLRIEDLAPFIGEIAIAGQFPDHGEDFAHSQIVALVAEYVARLPSELRRVHEAMYVQGLSQRQAAEALGLGRQVVRTLESRLKEGLASVLRGAERLEVPSTMVVGEPALHAGKEKVR